MLRFNLVRSMIQAYTAHRVENSSWVRRLERMNQVHHRHDSRAFSKLNHLILTFHDSTFECVCDAVPDVSRATGTTPFEAALASRRRSE